MRRRQFIKQGGQAGLAALLFGSGSSYAENTSAAKPANNKRRLPWQNWSGYLHSQPANRVTPKTLDELTEVLKKSPSIRPVGAGHSFTPLVPTDGDLLSLRYFSGLKSHDPEQLTATFGAGTKLGQIGEPLNNIGQMLPNMPDVDEQTLAGAMSTATHGTGQNLGALHHYVKSLQLVTASGDVINCSAEHQSDIFDAAKVSLGALGVVTEYTLQNIPSGKMKRRTWILPIDDMLEQFDELAAKHYSFEFYYIPFCDHVMAISIDPTDEPITPPRVDKDNDGAQQLKQLRDYLGWWPGLRRWLLNMSLNDLPQEEHVDLWYKVFPSERAVRFNEMEYHLEREHVLPTLKKVRDRLEKNHNDVFFPCEVRVVDGKTDNAMLSPFFQHDSASIAVHRYFADDPLPYFADIEPFYQPIKGRPHWGKMHTLTHEQLVSRYPRWQEFAALRAQLDPQGKMLNPYLKQLFGV